MLALLLFLISCPYCLPQATITQSSPFLILRPGDPGSLWCTVSNAGDPYMYWYRQGRQDKTLTLVSTSVSVNSVEELTLTHFTATRNTSSDFYLSTKSVAGNDSGVYYCAWSRTTSTVYFGSGTVISVLEEGKEQKKPDVSIYRPKKRELEDNNFISLVCMASNFFPEHVKIRWFVNSEERINLYEPVPQKNADDSYSTSKRLTLTREEYFNPDTTFRCVAAFLDGTLEASEEIKGETDCGVSKEFYTMYINQGKISYIMVLCKSGLYALVVLVLVWRKKVIAHSY